MPTLHWIGKDKIVNHHLDVPYRVLNHKYGFKDGEQSDEETKSGNMIIQGDNLDALKALLPKYEGRIKCIYIDPPYNTGNEGWIYNDNVNDPKIKKWLGSVVGQEGEDLSRHDKWLSMMYPRLRLLHRLLKNDGAIFVSIDDNEQANLKFLMDEIFGSSNRVGTIIWKNATDNNPTNIASEHEYILCYAKDKEKIPAEWKSTSLAVKAKLIEVGNEFINKFSDKEKRQAEYTKWFRENKDYLWPFDRYKYIDDGGVFTGSQSVHNPGKEGYRYDVIHPVTLKACIQPLMGYRFPNDTMNTLISEGRIIFGENENKIIELKVYAKDYRAKLSSLFELDGRIGTYTIKEIFSDEKRAFDFPKPTELIEEILSFTTSENDLILDSFAGSGTTAHAVFNLNKQDGGNRKFILVELGDYADSITAERNKRVIQGYGDTEGTGGAFDFYDLGAPLFKDAENLNEEIGIEKIREYVWYTETQKPMREGPHKNTYFLGSHLATDYYFFYEKDAITTLDYAFLATFENKAESYIIYADQCALTEKYLLKHGIIFKKIPRDISKI